MEKQTKPKPLGLSMAKLVLVVAVIVSLGAALGVIGYALTKQKCAVQWIGYSKFNIHNS